MSKVATAGLDPASGSVARALHRGRHYPTSRSVYLPSGPLGASGAQALDRCGELTDLPHLTVF